MKINIKFIKTENFKPNYIVYLAIASNKELINNLAKFIESNRFKIISKENFSIIKSGCYDILIHYILKSESNKTLFFGILKNGDFYIDIEKKVNELYYVANIGFLWKYKDKYTLEIKETKFNMIECYLGY